ncbi:MAG: OmpA family protein, partial [Saprospiraceae bacterium]|nr:OmpA family protein [Saprospiraceae bacterium]
MTREPIIHIRTFVLIIALTFIFGGEGLEAQRNIVPNGSFEEYSNPPLGWFYRGDHFSRVIKYWDSPTAASPDVFGPKVLVPELWAEKGFGEHTARSGSTMVGITVYGCDEGKPHCREYLQIHLAEPLVKGQRYDIKGYFSPLERSLRVNKFGFAFSKEPQKKLSDEIIDLKPTHKARFPFGNAGTWTLLQKEFVAQDESEFLILGNFSPDDNTIVEKVENHLNYGYYYVDDISLKKLEPILEVPVQEDDLSKIKLVPGKVVTLKHIYFDHDRVELLPRSFIELNKLKSLLSRNPNLEIEIRGHTDNVGDDLYNLSLSKRRAQSVAKYLFDQGISKPRIRYVGFGSEQPISDNETNDGRQLNRRVEFLILSK